MTANLPLGHFTHERGGNQSIKMTPDGGGRQAEGQAERDRALRAVFVQRAGDPITGSGVVMGGLRHGGGQRRGDNGGFHNTYVTYFPDTPLTDPGCD